MSFLSWLDVFSSWFSFFSFTRWATFILQQTEGRRKKLTRETGKETSLIFSMFYESNFCKVSLSYLPHDFSVTVTPFPLLSRERERLILSFNITRIKLLHCLSLSPSHKHLFCSCPVLFPFPVCFKERGGRNNDRKREKRVRNQLIMIHEARIACVFLLSHELPVFFV